LSACSPTAAHAPAASSWLRWTSRRPPAPITCACCARRA
jgi:hypothetical protein